VTDPKTFPEQLDAARDGQRWKPRGATMSDLRTWEIKRLNDHAASIANYATTHEKWTGRPSD
jgi:hypothetical protein